MKRTLKPRAGNHGLQDGLALTSEDVTSRPHVVDDLHGQIVIRYQVLCVNGAKVNHIHHGVVANHKRGQICHFHVKVVNVLHFALLHQHSVPHDAGI